MKVLPILTISSIALLSGCVTQSSLISKGNFEKLGFYDGAGGRVALTTTQLDKISDKYDATETPNYQEYQQGYSKGRDNYCSIEHVLQLGEQGKVNWGICEYRREVPLFKAKWQQGFERYGTMEPRF
ncbi:DUF2799 domain-containing protein [Photobacterium angustum]|uniref:DUF2799 domain-containing protein n=1 Tax=Photobacterium angustum (strain S14 / CCUG 15956) TaxID=314292 RepID=Q1ZN72_PHOAS|nr:DUF2799 domain-containing protein [Photobacterium angustum]EAS63857.1 hypothetical protein VAS14_20606 [Vibrio angustum S14] [Photobacterium angustum S14]KJF93431.1 hypothetical protein UB39_15100 [Photobacterium angustum]KJG04148.1 hypothetical protein UB33_20450 [Photobacterium angustum]PSV87617.1 DUF2799 domain-containing protein [Photobacterium angustum]PSW76208.1 DUF2799 domain-containing protein [Photobacterium angustum]